MVTATINHQPSTSRRGCFQFCNIWLCYEISWYFYSLRFSWRFSWRFSVSFTWVYDHLNNRNIRNVKCEQFFFVVKLWWFMMSMEEDFDLKYIFDIWVWWWCKEIHVVRIFDGIWGISILKTLLQYIYIYRASFLI